MTKLDPLCDPLMLPLLYPTTSGHDYVRPRTVNPAPPVKADVQGHSPRSRCVTMSRSAISRSSKVTVN